MEGPGLLTGNARYKVISYLQEGGFGSVQLAMDKQTDEVVAIKFMERGVYMNSKYVASEIINHSRMMHPHIVQFKDVFLTDTHLAIVMEYVRGGDLFSYVNTKGGLKEDEARFFYQQIITALHYCHKQGIVHRDLKLENILVDMDPKFSRPILKLCDFGYSKNEPNSKPKSAVGTPGYTAPEVLTSGGETGFEGEPVDVWGSGVMLYAMLFGILPFERKEDKADPHRRLLKIMNRILKADVVVPDKNRVSGDPVSPELKDLLYRIFQLDPAQRPRIADIQRHPWFAKDLPCSVDQMTERCLQLASKVPTVPEGYVYMIVEEARTTPTAVRISYEQGGPSRGFGMPGQAHMGQPGQQQHAHLQQQQQQQQQQLHQQQPQGQTVWQNQGGTPANQLLGAWANPR